jgi:hemoglobin
MLDPERSLYHRLGGYDAVAAFVDDLLPRLTSDPDIGIFWRGKCEDSMKKDRQLLVDFLCMITGGPVHYAGRDMKTSHKGLAISESAWNIFAQHAAASLDDLGVAARETEEVLTLAASFKAEIVEVREASGVGR